MESIDDFIRRGELQYEAGVYQLAATTFTKILENNHHSYPAHFGLGRSLVKLKDYSSAEYELNYCKYLLPDISGWHYYLGVILFLTDRHEELQSILEKAQKLDVDYTTSLYNAAEVFAENLCDNMSLLYYDQILENNPKHALALSSKGVVLVRNDKMNEGLVCLRKAASLAPKNYLTLYNLSSTLAEMGEINKALSYLERAINVESQHAEAHANRGVCFASRGKYKLAVDCFNLALEINPYLVNCYISLGVVSAELGRYEMADDCYRNALELDPKNAKAYYNRGGLRVFQKKYTNAIRDCDISLALCNVDEINNVLNIKGAALIFLHRYDEALQCFQRILLAAPKDSAALENITFLKGKM